MCNSRSREIEHLRMRQCFIQGVTQTLLAIARSRGVGLTRFKSGDELLGSP